MITIHNRMGLARLRKPLGPNVQSNFGGNKSKNTQAF